MNGLNSMANFGGYGSSTPVPTYNSGAFSPFNSQPQSFNNGRPNMISGRVVKNENEINIGEVPMNGEVSLFPTEDYSCIYAKIWDNSGQVRTFKFIPEETQPKEIEAKVIPLSQQQEILDLVNDRFNDLERLIKRNNNHKPYNKNYKKPYNKRNQNGSSGREDSE